MTTPTTMRTRISCKCSAKVTVFLEYIYERMTTPEWNQVADNNANKDLV